MSEIENMFFEEVMCEFEVMVGKLEYGEVMFEEFIVFYECGVKLWVYCDKVLCVVEECVEKIIFVVNGQFNGIVLVEGL